MRPARKRLPQGKAGARRHGFRAMLPWRAALPYVRGRAPVPASADRSPRKSGRIDGAINPIRNRPGTRFRVDGLSSAREHPSPALRVNLGPIGSCTLWDRGFLVTPFGTRWPGTQSYFPALVVRAGGPLRTARATPAPTASFGGRGTTLPPQVSSGNSRLEKRSVVAAPASSMRRLPRLCRNQRAGIEGGEAV